MLRPRAQALLGMAGVAALAASAAVMLSIGTPSAQTAPPASTCLRLLPADQALLPEGACDELGDWWQTAEHPAKWGDADTLVGMVRDPWWHPLSLRVLNDYGATANTPDANGDGIPDDDDTLAIQAALDDCYAQQVHCFIVAAPGRYDVEEVYPDGHLGATFWGGGEWSLKRQPYAFFESKYGPDPEIVHDFAAWSVMINLKAHYICSSASSCVSRVYYRCDGPEPCAPVRVIGLEIDGNAEQQRPDYASHYSQEHAHLIQVGNIGYAEVHSRLEIRDSLLRSGTADAVALDVNAVVEAERVVCDGLWRGCINALHSNTLATLEDIYVTTSGLPVVVALDWEPQGVSSGTDPVTGEDAATTVRLYLQARRIVLGAGADLWINSSPDPGTLVGGWLDFEQLYLLRPRLYVKAMEGSVTIADSYLRTCVISAPIERDPGRVENYGYSSIRFSRDVTIRDTTVSVCKPSDTEIASAWTIKPTLPRLWVYGLYVEQANPTTPRANLGLTLDGVTIAMDDPRPVDSRVRQIGLYYYTGDAAQDHRLDLVGGSISADFDWALYQWQGGQLTVDGTLAEGAVELCSYAHPSGNYAHVADDTGALAAGSATPHVCTGNNGATFAVAVEGAP